MEDLDTLVRRVDEDRWLASRFASEPVRQRLIAIYAVNYEIARTPETVREPALGDIRLQWWRDALANKGQGAQAHPALSAYAAVQPLPTEAWDAIITARRMDLEPEPFATSAAFDAYLDATAANVMRLAIAACGGDPSASKSAWVVEKAAWLWGCVGMLRSEAHWRARGRSFLPRDGGAIEDLIDRAERAAHDVHSLPRLDGALFPAVGYVALARGYLRRLRSRRDAPPLLARQFRLIGAAATGRL